MTSPHVQVSQPLLFAVAIMSEETGISEESDNNSSDFTDVSVLPVGIIDENGFSDSSEENQAERGVEPI